MHNITGELYGNKFYQGNNYLYFYNHCRKTYGKKADRRAEAPRICNNHTAQRYCRNSAGGKFNAAGKLPCAHFAFYQHGNNHVRNINEKPAF